VEREAMVRGYASMAGYAQEQVNVAKGTDATKPAGPVPASSAQRRRGG
jgi:hypothetical protein